MILQMAVALKQCIFDPTIVKPKCVWGLAVLFSQLLYFGYMRYIELKNDFNAFWLIAKRDEEYEYEEQNTQTKKRSCYRVFHLISTKSKLLILWNEAFLTLCYKDQNWFEEWQFCLTNFHVAKKLKKIQSFCKSKNFFLAPGESWTWDL